MSLEEHDAEVQRLEKIYKGKKCRLKSGEVTDEIVEVRVDFRPNFQYMNRIVTESGRIFFLTDIQLVLEKGDDI